MNIHREWQTGIKCIFLKLGVRTNVRARTTSSIMPAFVGTGMRSSSDKLSLVSADSIPEDLLLSPHLSRQQIKAT